jgi:hypothetical protein
MRCLLVLALAAAVYAQDQPCSKQMELEKRCMLTIETSPEATMIRDRKKQVMKTCVPDMPQECHAQWEAAHDCAIQISKNADSDELFTESKSKSQPAVDQCFEKYPPNVKEGFEEIFMMGKPPPPKFHHWRRHHRNETESGESGNASGESGESSGESSSNETDSSSFERRHGGGGRGGGGRHHGGGGRGGGGRHHHGGGGRGGHGRHCHGGGRHHGGRGGRGGRGGHGGHGRHHHGPRNFTSSENSSSESGSTSSESGGVSGGRSGGKSGGRSFEKKGIPEQCRKTPEQWKCIKDEFKKLGDDKSVITIMNTLIRQKKKCKQIVDWSCSASCPKRRHCVFKATRPCRQAFMTRMKTCMQDKGFTLPPFMQGHDAFTTPTPVVQQD